MAFSPSGRPAISYIDLDRKTLKYATHYGDLWEKGVVDNLGRVGLKTSLAFTKSGRPAISYFDGSLHYAAHDGASWQVSAIDSANVAGMHPSLAAQKA